MPTDTSPARRVTVFGLMSVLALIVAFVLAVLPTVGPIADYEFARGAVPTDVDVLVARIEVVASIAGMVVAVGSFLAAATAKQTRAVVVLGALGVLVVLAYVPLLAFAFILAF